MIAQRPTARGWHEPLRIALTVLWVVTLTLWVYYQVLLMCSGMLTKFLPAVGGASMILRSVTPLWLASFFPALAVGLAWYGFTRRLAWSGSSHPVRGGLDRLTRGQLYMTLCTALCLFLLVWRLLPLLLFVTSGWERMSRLTASTFVEWRDYYRVPGMIEPLAAVGAAGAGLVFLQVWGLVRHTGGRRRNLLALTATLLALGLLAPWLGVLFVIPSPIPPVVRDLDRTDPAVRGLFLDDEAYLGAGERVLARYVDTHDDLGCRVTFHDALAGYLERWNLSRDETWTEAPHRQCELCLLPGVALWTMSGLPVLLREGADPPEAPATLVVEIPRRATECRVYDPEVPESFTSGALEELPRLVQGEDRIILKIDWMVEMPVVLDLFETLRDLGVVQVDLAVMSFGFIVPPPDPATLVLGGDAAPATYEPRERPGKKKIIVIQKYVPPGEQPDPRRRCGEVDGWMHRDAWDDWSPEQPGSLPASVSIETMPKQLYGRFIGILQNAIGGGAQRIYLRPAPSGE